MGPPSRAPFPHAHVHCDLLDDSRDRGKDDDTGWPIPRRSAKSRLAALETDSLAMASRTESEDGGYGGRSWDEADLPILASISIQGRSHPLLLPTGNSGPRGSWSSWLQQACCGLGV
ncbi:hypothetical protein MRS44_000409 [Fusarium solani]|uniref:uncharacterized protein n=1 Tax=Fusarium solani TaxID=169388 RepID=UPI0032C4B1B1|nr:hypothetical protein MRS44_000409 [Fusarium solani]